MSSYPEILLTLRRFIGNLTNFSSPFVGSHLDKGDKLIGQSGPLEPHRPASVTYGHGRSSRAGRVLDLPQPC